MKDRLQDPDSSLAEARSAVVKARAAMRNENRTEARQWAEKAAALAPQLEDPWLILAAIASPRASVEYIQKALQINPNSPRARQGMQWAMQRLRESPPSNGAEEQGKRAPVSGSARRDAETPKKSGAGRSRLFPILLFALGCLVFAAAAWSAANSPALASIIRQPVPQATAAHPPSWAQASIPKPTYTPGVLPTPMAAVQEPAATPTPLPTNLPTEAGTQMADVVPTATSLPTAEPTWIGSLSLEYVQDTPTSQIPTAAPAATRAASSPAVSGGQRWIDVNLSQQMVYAYEGDTVVNSFLVSTGTWLHPTVTGQYHIYVKLRYTDMSGPDYYLPNVPYTMYFYEGYGLHGTYWHHNFGTPMSHGCVNLSTPDAEWLYNWASVGTLVNVHY